MGAIGNTYPTMIDVARRLDPNGSIAEIIEYVNKVNPMVNDAPTVEGNLPTGHRYTRRTGLPTVGWRKINSGVVPGKSQTAQYDEGCGILEAYADVDKKLADLNGNSAAWRLSENAAYIEAMGQEAASTLLYGNVDDDPEEFDGFMNRSSLNALGDQCLGAGGTSNLASILLAGWDPKKCSLLYPKGSKAGLDSEDKGQVTLGDATNGYYEGYRSHYVWELGLVIPDPRYVVRIANIDTVALATFNSTSDTSADLLQLMIRAYNAIHNIDACNPVFYMNKTVKTWLDIIANTGTNRNVTIAYIDGKPVTTFFGVPVRKCDAMLSAESQVS
jgi:hypothetical protein